MSAERRIVLIPTYNEAQNVGDLYESIREVCDYSILFVDDHSPDNTADEIERVRGRDRKVRLLRRPEKTGLGRAYRDAYAMVLDEGDWDRVFMMDADLSHQPRYLPDIDAALDESDFVIGSRYLHGVSVLNWSIIRLNLSLAANRYIRAVTRLPVADCTSGFRGFKAEILPLLVSSRVRASGYAFLVETLYRIWRAGFSITEVPIVFVERTRGSSKVSWQVFMESLLTPLRLRTGTLLGFASDPERSAQYDE
ncbi:glycosyltransferase [Candidatus Fermentibacteria bacterium]|nr:glycosyltransferase [Candidatus Fermentibacteria bacterium]